MVIRQLPAPADPPKSSDETTVSTSLVPVTRGALAMRVSARTEIVHSADTYSWSTRSGRAEAPRIYGTPVEDSEGEEGSSEKAASAWEYVSSLAWGGLTARTVAMHYLMYAARAAAGNGSLIDVFA